MATLLNFKYMRNKFTTRNPHTNGPPCIVARTPINCNILLKH